MLWLKAAGTGMVEVGWLNVRRLLWQVRKQTWHSDRPCAETGETHVGGHWHVLTGLGWLLHSLWLGFLDQFLPKLLVKSLLSCLIMIRGGLWNPKKHGPSGMCRTLQFRCCWQEANTLLFHVQRKVLSFFPGSSSYFLFPVSSIFHLHIYNDVSKCG